MTQKFLQGVCALFALCAFGVFRVHVANAASFYFSPSSGSYTKGESISVGVFVSTGTDSMNAASAKIAFPPSVLNVTSVSKSGSIINLWAAEPSYSNSTGSVSLEGIVLNPGYTGASGKVATITFTAQSSGTATISFSRGSILANDGLGTDILSGLGSATFTIADSVATPSESGESAQPSQGPPTTPTAVPRVPSVTSSTHPDSEAWYANGNPAFAWSLPSGVTGVNVLADRHPNSDPGTTSDGLRSSYIYTDVDDGEWYFHIKFLNAIGWGATAHFAFRIDTALPTVSASASRSGDASTVVVDGFDALSGIDHYTFAVDGADAILWTDDGSHTYRLPELEVGNHAVVVSAFDRAGNIASAVVTVVGTGIHTVAPVEEPQTAASVPGASVRVGNSPLVWIMYGLLALILLFACAAVLVLFWKALRQASQYKIVLVKRELPQKDPYRHLRKRFSTLFIRAKKKSERIRSGSFGRPGKRGKDRDFDYLLDDIISQARSMRSK